MEWWRFVWCVVVSDGVGEGFNRWKEEIWCVFNWYVFYIFFVYISLIIDFGNVS